MVKRTYEFVDVALSKQRERELEEREEKEATRIFKVCPKCGERKPLFQFTTDKRNTNGRTNICKSCKIIEYLKYYYENKDRILKREKEHRENNGRERSIYHKDYQRKNKERLSKLAREWYQANKAAIKKRNTKYFKENREACLNKRKLWREKNKKKIREYNREYKRKNR